MEMDDEIRELILVGASAVELKKKAIERGMITLRRSGLAQGNGRRDHARRSGTRDGSLKLDAVQHAATKGRSPGRKR